MQPLILKWLRWRYGGNRMALKPPLGYHPVYSPKSALWVAGYKVRRAFWRLECWLFNWYGRPMRAAFGEDRADEILIP